MTLIADSGALYALYDADDQHHLRVRSALEAYRGPIVVPTAILAELDYLLREFLDIEAELDFLESLQNGAFLLEPFTSSDLERCRELLAKYRDLDLGLADTAVIATAERLETDQILTVDERHFRAIVSKKGRPFTLFPADATT
jgi:predicted nucleic acid-binding protein